MAIISPFLRKEINMQTDVAILAGGWFWGVHELLRKLDGVIR